MKKTLNFLRSMRFGIILLVLIALLSAVGSLINQGQEVAWYANTYGRYHGVILMLGLNDIYHSWYFVLLLALMCLNLTLCSIVRIKSVVRASKNAAQTAARVPSTEKLSPEKLRLLREHLRASHCKETVIGEARIYSRRNIGRYGTFITHLAILLTVVFGAAALYLPKTIDHPCFPGEGLIMADGTEIDVATFRIEDGDGRLDFTSEIEIISPNGNRSGLRSISVNHPLSFGGYKVYQQTYGTAGSITVRDPATGETDDFTLNEVSFLSADGVNGVWYENLYPGYIEAADGSITIISSTSGSYADPVYQVILAEDGNFNPMLMFPGDKVAVGELEFIFNAPVEYPGLRIKHTPAIVNALLVIAFVLMIAGLYITFFMPPVLVKTDDMGYAVCGPKPEYTQLNIKMFLGETEEKL